MTKQKSNPRQFGFVDKFIMPPASWVFSAFHKVGRLYFERSILKLFEAEYDLDFGKGLWFKPNPDLIVRRTTSPDANIHINETCLICVRFNPEYHDDLRINRPIGKTPATKKFGFYYRIIDGLKAYAVMKGCKVTMPHSKDYDPRKFMQMHDIKPTENDKPITVIDGPPVEMPLKDHCSFEGDSEELVKASIELNNLVIETAHEKGLTPGKLILLKDISEEDLIRSKDHFGHITYLNHEITASAVAHSKNSDEQLRDKSDRTLMYLGAVEGTTPSGYKMKIQRWLKGKSIVMANISPLVYDVINNGEE